MASGILVDSYPCDIPLHDRDAGTSVLQNRRTLGLPGFPKLLKGPMTWENQIFETSPETYVLQLSPTDIAHVERALRHFQGLDLPDGFINRETFPLPAELSARLKAVSVTLHDGRGFEIVRGLSPHKYSDKENIVLFAGITSHVADRRSRQLHHVYDSSNTKRPGKITPPFLPVKMSFHTDVDGGDILSLYISNAGHQGGDQYLSSAWQVYNHLAKECPEQLKVLAEDWPWEEVDWMTGNSKLAMKPILYSVDDKVQVSYTTAHLMGSQYGERPASFPSVSPAQLLAHNTVQALAEKFSFKLQHQDGDILLMNNLSIFHARDAYTDAKEAPGPKRHLMRMYLRDTDRAWPKPDAYRQILDNQFDYMPEEQKYATLQEDMELGEFLDNVDLTKKAPKRDHD